MKTRNALLLTCEHGGNRIPAAYTHLFRGAKSALASHRGWDPGALSMAQRLAKLLHRPLLANTWSRLFVEPNRSAHSPRIWSSFTKDLPRTERERILERWWQPHRTAVKQAVAAEIVRGHRVIHVAVHSFTPELDGEVRNADITFLYDSRRKREAGFCRRWRTLLEALDPTLRMRFNYPYLGADDGLTTALRKQHPQSCYIGVELELNQALVGSDRWRTLGRDLAQCLTELVGR
jgi:predicted N-formylglutamate amidohydrolase